MSEQAWNDIYVEWLKGWAEEASSTHAALTYTRAYRSLNDSEKQYGHPQELKELRFIGQKICDNLEKQLNKFCKETGITGPVVSDAAVSQKNPTSRNTSAVSTVLFISPASDKPRHNDSDPSTPVPQRTGKRASKPKPKRSFIPRYRSGGYALLIALRKYSRYDSQGMGRTDLCRLAKPYCNKPFNASASKTGFNTSWSAMKTLIKNDLVYQSSAGSPQYLITEEGKVVADKLILLENQASSSADGRTSSTGVEFIEIGTGVQSEESEFSNIALPADLLISSNSSPVSSTNLFRTAQWPAGSFHIKLLLDNREVVAKEDRDYFSEELRGRNIPSEVTALAVGDFQWVAEHNESGHRVVLDYIIERKRLDDLVASIKDGRLYEQKSRLHRSSLTNVFYLVEERASFAQLREAKAIQTIMSQTISVDGFHLVRTSSAEETTKFLEETTILIENLYKDSRLTVVWPHVFDFEEGMAKARQELGNVAIGIDFDTFASALSKSRMLTVRDLFVRMLMTSKGITYERARSIQKVYGTPAKLFEAFQGCSSEDRKKFMISDATAANIPLKRVSKKISESLYHIWGDVNIECMAS